MPRRAISTSTDRRLPFPLQEVWLLVCDAARQPEWMIGNDTVWETCKVQHACGPLAGPGARYIRVLEDAEGVQDIMRLETLDFEEAQYIAFNDGRSFTVQSDGEGTLLTAGHEAKVSTGGVSRAFRKAFKSEEQLMDDAELHADLDRIEHALQAAAQRKAAEQRQPLS